MPLPLRPHAKRIACALCVIFMMAGFASCAFAQEAPAVESLAEPFCGSFPEKVYLRESPVPSARTLTWVPSGTRLMLTPVSERYAETEYQGKKGYVHLGGVVVEDLADQPTEPFTAYGKEPLTLQMAPYPSAAASALVQPYTPLTITGANGGYLAISLGEEKAYALFSKLTSLPPDVEIEPYTATLREPSVLLSHPLSGGLPLSVVGMRTTLTVTALNGAYALIQSEEGNGYVALEKLLKPSSPEESLKIGFAIAATPLYSLPDLSAYTQSFLSVNDLVAVDATLGEFYRVYGGNAYVRADAIGLLTLKPAGPFLGYWEADQPLLRQDGSSIASGSIIPGKLLVEISFSYGDDYLVFWNGACGFAPAKDFHKIDGALSKDTMAITTKSIPLRALPSSDSPLLSVSIPEGTGLWLGQPMDGFYIAQYGSAIGYVDASKLSVLEQETFAQPQEVYFDQEATLLSFPWVGDIQATANENSLGKAIARAGGYLYVIHEAGEGYVSSKKAWTLEQVENGEVSTQKYLLSLNKATRELSIFYADESGAPKQLLKTIIVAIGKRTTPTPSGTFALGQKERWHYFGPSYVPFAIDFTPGRYLHGPLYWTANESSLRKEHLADFGTMATGGCIRTPYDDMLWIYYHCTGSNTTLEVVNGR